MRSMGIDRQRRHLIAGIAASAALAPLPGWAELPGAVMLAAGQVRGGEDRLFGLSASGEIVFSHELPARGHAAAAHPLRPEAVGFARRPGQFAIVLEARKGTLVARLNAPMGVHFYGHGAFTRDGRYLLTTENLYDEARGQIGVWDSANGYRRVGFFESGGVGPHEIVRLPGEDVFAVANGGIETHPDTGRLKLNIPEMQPNLSYLSPQGALLEQVFPPESARLASIRHLGVSAGGVVAMGMQWQGARSAEPAALLALHRRSGGELRWIGGDQARALSGYVGSVAVASDGAGGEGVVGITSPRGGVVQRFSLLDGAFLGQESSVDVCGICAVPGGFCVSSGTRQLAGRDHQGIRWDNHLVSLVGVSA